jgi:hypothetical protein
MAYDIIEHKHRYSAWAASRAASTKTCRFNVLQGKSIIEDIGLQMLVRGPEHLPLPCEIDGAHREWRECALKSASRMNLMGFGHGIAAKLINVYLKGAFVCAGHDAHPSVAALHPPIDSLLLEALAEHDSLRETLWKQARKIKWSKFGSSEYEMVIKGVRALQGSRPLWQVEEHWRGYQ